MIVTDPFLLKGAVGAKVTPIVHVSPAASEVPHVSVSAKSPLAETLAMFSGVFLSLVNVAVCALVRLEGSRTNRVAVCTNGFHGQ